MRVITCVLKRMKAIIHNLHATALALQSSQGFLDILVGVLSSCVTPQEVANSWVLQKPCGSRWCQGM